MRALAVPLALAAVLAALPLLFPGRGLMNFVFLVLLYAALAQAWNLLSGFAGQVNLGHAAFFGLGALVTRVLWIGGNPLVVALVAGTLAAAGAALIVGVPSLRLRGPYFAIGTLAIAEILRITVGNLLPEVSALPASLLAVYTLAPRYYLVLGLVVAVTGVAWLLTRSRVGYGLAAVREDEEVAEAVGVNAFRHKLGAFVLSGAFAGTAGAIFAYYHPSFYLQFGFNPLWTFDALLITFLGGIGTVWGPIIGAVVYLTLRELLALQLVELHLLIFGLAFIAIVVTLPGGLMEAAAGLRKWVSRRWRVQEMAPPVPAGRVQAGVEKAPPPGGATS